MTDQTPNSKIVKILDKLTHICLGASQKTNLQRDFDQATTQLQQLIVEARIESLQWALDDYNMADADTPKNLEGYIAELQAQLNKEVDNDL